MFDESLGKSYYGNRKVLMKESMPKEKRTFFGKIMGGNLVDETSTASVEEQEEDTDVEMEALENPETLEIEETEVEETEESVPVAVSAASRQERTEGGHEEWLSDYEGQLNIDMYQTKDNVIIKSTIAGVRPEDMDITVANDMVTIKGARRREEQISEDDYFYQECYWGNFSRSVIIPVDIDSEHIEADLKDGILTVVVPKAAKAKTKKIKVKGI